MKNKIGKERLIGSFFALVIIGLLVIAGPAEALSFSISDIPDTNKGDTLEYDIRVNVLDSEQLPLEHSTLIIRKTGSFFDVFTCIINSDASYSCTRQRGSSSAPINPDDSITITRSNVNGSFGYGYFSGGDLIFHVTWHTPVNLKPGQYGTKLIIESNENRFESPEKLFNIITPARPRDRFSIRARGVNAFINQRLIQSNNDINFHYSNIPPEQGQSTLEIQGRNVRLGINMDRARLINNDEDEIIVKYRGSGIYNRQNVEFREITIHVDKHTHLVDIHGIGDVEFQLNNLQVFFSEPIF